MRWTLLFALVLSLFGCGLKNLTGTKSGISSGEAAIIAKQMSQGFANGISGVAPAPPASSLKGPGPLPVAVNVSIDHTTTCTAGGSLHIIGSMTGNIDNSGTGVLLLGVTETISDWKCDSNLVINGDPDISVAGNMNFLSGAMSSAATFSFGGGIKWGTSASQSCPINLTVLINTDMTGEVSGTVCGNQVNETI